MITDIACFISPGHEIVTKEGDHKLSVAKNRMKDEAIDDYARSLIKVVMKCAQT